MFLKKQQQHHHHQLSSNLFNFCRRRRFYSQKSAFVFFEDYVVDVEGGEETYAGVKVPRNAEIPKEAILFSKSRHGTLPSVISSLRDEIMSLNDSKKSQELINQELFDKISNQDQKILKQTFIINELKEGQSILLNNYLVLNLPQFLENCASRVLRDHNPEMESALGRVNRMGILLTMVNQGHPKASSLLDKPEVSSLLKAHQLLLVYEGVKKRNLLGHDKNIWFDSLSRSLSKLEAFASFHNEFTKENLTYFNKIIEAMEPWKNIPVLESDLKESDSDDSDQ